MGQWTDGEGGQEKAKCLHPALKAAKLGARDLLSDLTAASTIVV